MDQISKNINYSNHKIHSYDQMSKMIVNLGSKKFKNNYTSTCKIIHPHNLLVMSIVDTPEKDVSKFNWKSVMRKVRTYKVNLSSKLVYCSIHAMYN